MLTDGNSASVPAGATVNLFSGRPVEFLGSDSNVELLLAADAALVTAAVLVNRGGVQMAPISSGMPVNTAAAAGEGPKADEDRVAVFAVPAGSRLQLNVTNGGAAATNVRYRAIITP